jgi:hypothetical protein
VLSEGPAGGGFTAAERQLIGSMCSAWGWNAHHVPIPIKALGFPDEIHFSREIRSLATRIEAGGDASLTDIDLARILFLTEMCWASDIIGCGVEFSMIFGPSDTTAIGVLRGLQRKLSSPRRARMVFSGLATPRPTPRHRGPLAAPPQLLVHPARNGHPPRGHRRGSPLTTDERSLIWHALALWDGPISAKPIPIKVFGFSNWSQLDATTQRLRDAVADSCDGDTSAISDLDRGRMQLFTEIAWGSGLIGAGLEFARMTQISDRTATGLLRRIQRKLGGCAVCDELVPGHSRRPDHGPS